MSLTTVFFFYGLAFILLGILIFILPRRNDFFDIADNLWLVGIFAIIHGINEWVDLCILIGRPFNTDLFNIIGSLLLPFSFVFLSIFGFRLISKHRPHLKRLRYTWIIGLLLWFFVILFTRSLLVGNIAARYFLCLPGVFMTAFGLDVNYIEKDKKHVPKIVKICMKVSIYIFILYGVLSGLIVPKAYFLPASIINYVTFSDIFGIPVQFFRMICSMILTFSFFWIVRTFYCYQANIRLKGGIRRRISTFVFMALFVITVIGIIVGYFFAYNLLSKTIAQDYRKISDALAINISGRIDDKVVYLKAVLANPDLQAAVLGANSAYHSMDNSAMQTYMHDMDKKWSQARYDSLLVEQYTKIKLADELRRVMREDTEIVEIFITDIYGGLVVSSGKTSDFYQADEDWWRVAYDDGRGKTSVFDIEFDESSDAFCVPFIIPLRDTAGRLIGLCKAVIGINKFLQPLKHIKINDTGHAFFINEKGNILYHDGINPLSEEFEDLKNVIEFLNDGRAGMVVFSKTHKKKMFIVCSPVESAFFAKKGVIWNVCIAQEPREIFMPLRHVIFQALMMLLFMLMLALLPLVIFSGKFSKPILKLQDAAEHITKGELDYKFHIDTGDEIEELANSFTIMAISLKERQDEILSKSIYLESVLASIADTLVVFNTNGIIKNVNNTMCRLLDYTQQELIGQPIRKIVLDSQALDECLKKIIKESLVSGVDLTYITKKGEYIPVNFSGSLVYGPDTDASLKASGGKMQLAGIVGIGRDMRQILKFIDDLEKSKNAIEQYAKNLFLSKKAMLNMMEDLTESKAALERSNRELRKIDQVKTDFVSTVSHELRTPLSIAREGISLVLDKVCGDVTQEQKGVLITAKDNIDRLTRIVNNLLDISKMESGEIELKIELVNLVNVVRGISHAFDAMIKEKGLILRTNFTSENISIYVDADRIMQVFTNLIGNSIKFTKDGFIDVSVRELDVEVQCSVADTGIGVSADDLPNVFTKFRQFSRLPGPGEKGTGLGLSIVKEIIELHKGRIWIESQLGKGTEVTFCLPKQVA